MSRTALVYVALSYVPPGEQRRVWIPPGRYTVTEGRWGMSTTSLYVLTSATRRFKIPPDVFGEWVTRGAIRLADNSGRGE